MQFIYPVALASSLALNLWLAFRRRSKIQPKHPSEELQDFIHDLTAGSGVVYMRRIDPNDIILRSPKRGVK